MTIKIPSMLRNMKLYEGGTEFDGTVDVQLPNLKLKTETKQYPGMSAPAEFSAGTLSEPLKIGINAAELRTALLSGFVGQCQGLRTLNLRAIFKNLADCTSGKHNIVAVGFFTEIGLGTAKMGDEMQRKYEFSCHKFRYEINGTVVLDINVMDVDNADDRSFLG